MTNNTLLAHFKAMQAMATAYLMPETYVDREGKHYPEPDNNHDDHIRQELRNEMAKAFANDMIYMLDGPEQRAAEAKIEELSAPAMDTPLTYGRRFWSGRELELARQLDASKAETDRLQGEVDRMREALDCADMARTRLEHFADLANSGQAQAGGRELKRKIWGAFSDYDAARTLTGDDNAD